MACSSSGSRPEHNYPLMLQHLLVNLADGVGKGGSVTPIPVKRLASFEGAPAVSTLELWRATKRSCSTLPSKEVAQGRPPTVPEPERRITVGWVLRRLQKGKIVTGRDIIAFMKVGSVQTCILQIRLIYSRRPSTLMLTRLMCLR